MALLTGCYELCFLQQSLPREVSRLHISNSHCHRGRKGSITSLCIHKEKKMFPQIYPMVLQFIVRPPGHCRLSYHNLKQNLSNYL